MPRFETRVVQKNYSIEGIKNDNNVKIMFTPKILLIPPELRWKAKLLLKTELKVGSMDNDINVLKDEGLSYIVCHWMTSTTAWFVLADDHDLRLMWRDNVEFEAGDDFNTKSALYTSTFRLAVEFWDWRGTYGSPGT